MYGIYSKEDGRVITFVYSDKEASDMLKQNSNYKAVKLT